MATSTIPLSRFNIRFAKIGVHLRLHECEPVTYMVDCETIAGILKTVSAEMSTFMPKFDNFEAARETLRERMKQAQQEHDQDMVNAMCVMMLSLILNMPNYADSMRKGALDAFAAGHREYYFTVACNQHIAYIVTAGIQIADDATLDQRLELATHSKEHFFYDRDVGERRYPVERPIAPVRVH